MNFPFSLSLPFYMFMWCGKEKTLYFGVFRKNFGRAGFVLKGKEREEQVKWNQSIDQSIKMQSIKTIKKKIREWGAVKV